MTDTRPDLAAIRERAEATKAWVAVCGACDAGIPADCTHPDGDYRIPMLELLSDNAALLAEVERLTAENAQVRELHHEVPNPWWAEGSQTTPTFGATECAHDYRRWPCKTIRALDGQDS